MVEAPLEARVSILKTYFFGNDKNFRLRLVVKPIILVQGLSLTKTSYLKSWSISVPHEDLSICFIYNSPLRILFPELVVI